MKQHKNVLITVNLEKAEEALKTAQVNLEHSLLYGAQNRVYYAVFYAVTSLGYYEGFTTTKHSELFGWFNRVMVYEKAIFTKDMQETYKIAYESRKRSDYEVTYKPVKENLVEMIKETKEFVETIKAYILQQG